MFCCSLWAALLKILCLTLVKIWWKFYLWKICGVPHYWIFDGASIVEHLVVFHIIEYLVMCFTVEHSIMWPTVEYLMVCPIIEDLVTCSMAVHLVVCSNVKHLVVCLMVVRLMVCPIVEHLVVSPIVGNPSVDSQMIGMNLIILKHPRCSVKHWS